MTSRTAELESRLPPDFPYSDLWKPIMMLVLAVAPLAVVAPLVSSTYDETWSFVVPLLLLLVLIAVMIWPSAGTRGYFKYKTPLFIFTIVFELWILVLALSLQAGSGNFWFKLALGAFFLGTAMISLPWVEGEYRPGLFFRPDLLYGNGAYLARGEIFVALGIKLFTTPGDAEPVFGWWGIQWALAAMIFMVPFRGILKMRMRRARFLDLDNWLGLGSRSGHWVKEVFLYVSLLLLVYGFVNVFSGLVPFTWLPGDPPGPSPEGVEWWGLAFLGASFLIIVPLRGWYKLRIAEPAPLRQELLKNLMVWVGFLPMIYGFLLVFQGQGWVGFHDADPNFWWGLWISALGFLMLVPLRTYAQLQELKGTLRIMIPRMADLSEEQRRLMMGRRLEVLAAMPDEARKENLKLMMRIIREQPEPARQTLVRARTWLVASAPDAQRERLVSAMGMALGELDSSERVEVMGEVMGSVAELPEEKRRSMMAAMSKVMAA